MRLMLAAVIVLVFAIDAKACNRCGLFGRACVVQKVHVAKQAVVAVPYIQPYTVNYFVAQPIREQALVEQALREMPEWQEFLKFREWSAARGQGLTQQPGPQAIQNNDEASSAAHRARALPLLTARCVTCHSGDKPKAGLTLDGTAPIDTGYFASAARLMLSQDEKERMPKGKAPLTPAERLAALDELESLVRREEAETPPAPMPLEVPPTPKEP